MHHTPPSSKQQAARALTSSGGSHIGAKLISHTLPRKRMKGAVAVRRNQEHCYTATPHATPTAGAAAGVSAAAVKGGYSGVAPEPGQQQSMSPFQAMPPEKEANDEGGNGESAVVEEKRKGNALPFSSLPSFLL